MFSKILTVCTGNICRSPAAEGLLKHYLKDTHPDVEIGSAGTGALIGMPAYKHAVSILNDRNIDITSHRARQLKADLIAWTDLILVMETMHLKEVEARFPSARGKVFCLGKWQKISIPDPYKHPKEFFTENIALIDDCIKDWQTRLWS